MTGAQSTGDLPHVLVLGGGFAGLYAARALRDAPVRVTLVDRRNHHLFQPMLYQVATAGLNPSDIASPIRSILRRSKNTEVLLAEVEAWTSSDARSASPTASADLRLPDRRDRRAITRTSDMTSGSPGAWPQEPRGRARDPPPRPARVRACGAGDRSGPPACVSHIRDRGRWPDRRRDGGGRGRDPRATPSAAISATSIRRKPR